MNDIICFLYQWQTLLAGVLATIAAGITVRLMRHQIRLQKSELDAEQKRLRDTAKSQNWAARAHLPDALSEICEYAGACYRLIFDATHVASRPDRPQSAIASVKQAIEHADPVSAKALYELVVHYQVHNARLRSGDRQPLQNELAQRGYDAVLLRCLCNRLFEYGRNEEEFVSSDRLTRDLMNNAHATVGGLDGRYNRNADLNAAIERLIIERHDN